MSTSGSGLGLDALQLLASGHRAVERLFSEIEEEPSGAGAKSWYMNWFRSSGFMRPSKKRPSTQLSAPRSPTAT